MTRSVGAIWDDACLGACLCVLAPTDLGGIALRAGAGQVRDQWLRGLTRLLPAAMPMRRIPAGVSDSRLLGGLDLCATLAAGRPVGERGLLHEASGGLVVLAMAERLSTTAAARYMAVLDTHRVILERDGLSSEYNSEIGVIALDESDEGEGGAAPGLKDRLALHVDLRQVSNHDLSDFPWNANDVARATQLFPAVEIDESMVHALCSAAQALGIDSLRAPLLACRAARAVAALQGRRQVEEADVICAARLVLAPRATTCPAAESSDESSSDENTNRDEERQQQRQLDQPQEAPQANDTQTDPLEDHAQADASDSSLQPSDSPSQQDTKDRGTPDDTVLAATIAALPNGLLAQLKLGSTGRAANGRVGATGGRAGVARENLVRGRPVGSRRGELSGSARLHLLATLRAAAPWQALRRSQLVASALASGAAQPAPRVQIRRQDFAIRRFVQRAQTTTIFVVDASGSSALHRLAEAKGAVEQLLAECYIRRDRVAVLGFRHQTAELLLPPTRSLVRAKRSLAAMPSNGGTPLAAAIDAGAALADSVRRQGDTPFIVLLSDGRANVARDGRHDRAQARLDALSAGDALRAAQLTSLFVDTSPRSNIEAHHLADSMGAQYVALPYADSSSLCSAIRSAML
jgi:magnesium chelatase subunit D